MALCVLHLLPDWKTALFQVLAKLKGDGLLVVSDTPGAISAFDGVFDRSSTEHAEWLDLWRGFYRKRQELLLPTFKRISPGRFDFVHGFLKAAGFKLLLECNCQYSATCSVSDLFGIIKTIEKGSDASTLGAIRIPDTIMATELSSAITQGAEGLSGNLSHAVGHRVFIYQVHSFDEGEAQEALRQECCRNAPRDLLPRTASVKDALSLPTGWPDKAKAPREKYALATLLYELRESLCLSESAYAVFTTKWDGKYQDNIQLVPRSLLGLQNRDEAGAFLEQLRHHLNRPQTEHVSLLFAAPISDFSIEVYRFSGDRPEVKIIHRSDGIPYHLICKVPEKFFPKLEEQTVPEGHARPNYHFTIGEGFSSYFFEFDSETLPRVSPNDQKQSSKDIDKAHQTSIADAVKSALGSRFTESATDVVIRSVVNCVRCGILTLDGGGKTWTTCFYILRKLPGKECPTDQTEGELGMDSGAALLLLLDEADSKLWATPEGADFPPFVEASALALSSLLDLAYSRISAEIARLGEHNRQLERSQAFLLKLQKPLDRLTMAFAEVHSEAQEMQAILNSPEESLFRAHKLIADIFSDQGDITVSSHLFAKSQHAIGNLKSHDLTKIYALLVCSIFGKRSDLKDARNVRSLVKMASSVLADVQNSPAHKELSALLKVVLGLDSKEDLKSCLNHNEKNKRDSLNLLKLILFTPFKDFSNSNWPRAPFFIAAKGANVKASELQLPTGETDFDARIPMQHEYTPFPQHAILDFMLAAKSEYMNRGPRHFFKDVNFPPMNASRSRLEIEILYGGGGEFFISSKGTNLYSFARYATQHGISGRNYGNFLGCFARLLRHARSLEVEFTAARSGGEWVLVEPDQSGVLIAIERADRRRFFWIEDRFEKGEGKLRLVWDADGWNSKDKQATMNNEPIGKNPKSTDSVVGVASPNSPYPIPCFVIDHRADGPWAKALVETCEIEGKRGSLKIIGSSSGMDSPDRLLIPPTAKVIIVHTKQNMAVWHQAIGAKFGIVSVSTTGDPSLPPDMPTSITALKGILDTDFCDQASDAQLSQARNYLLKAVCTVYSAINAPAET